MRIDINIAAFVLLAVILGIAWKRLDRQDRLNVKFLRTAAIIMLELFLESATCIVNKRPELWLSTVSQFMHLFLFLTAPILTFFWFSFVYSWVVPEKNETGLSKILLGIPLMVNTIITLLSPLFGWVYSITADNTYQRGPLFLLSAACT
ncbi:MAG: GGDEF domain-containing protein, partial [Clostridiales bacterium]|nr:GGDEF domain-containing protein [Clostridiales bacterium]